MMTHEFARRHAPQEPHDSETLRKKTFHIESGNRLRGEVNPGGSKNGAIPIMWAATLCNTPSTIRGLPALGDTTINMKLLRAFGVNVIPDGDVTTIDPQNVTTGTAIRKNIESSRNSILTVGAMLGRLGHVTIPHPGGDALGPRPIDYHIKVMEALGAKFKEDADGMQFEALDGLKGGYYKFPQPSHLGTINGLLAAVNADGSTTLKNCALEPEVEEFIDFLTKAGARIKRDGLDPRTILIEGVRELNGVEDFEILPDRNAIVTYAVAAIATESEEGVTVKGAKKVHLKSFLSLLDEMGGGYKIPDDENEDWIRFFYKGELTAPKRTIVTCPYPNDQFGNENYLGIMTDWQPLVSLLLLKAKGTSRIIEAVHPDRSNT